MQLPHAWHRSKAANQWVAHRGARLLATHSNGLHTSHCITHRLRHGAAAPRPPRLAPASRCVE
eukprot:2921288-Lingulodinium_polyedra.AAC.1